MAERTLTAHGAAIQDENGDVIFMITIAGFASMEEAQRFGSLTVQGVATLIGETMTECLGGTVEADDGSPPPNRMN